ncbi:FAD-dependent oxidoreductase [Lichenihabitans psoromatis]|uniref:FAD-dependent oxidoreductase n=1 Tax=Lichenihabitans psoromatis TaxID=2528642 RepID=UPI0010362045|nr:FAD-dependent oxidoreductase [Lichenihabitans psoromatis]
MTRLAGAGGAGRRVVLLVGAGHAHVEVLRSFAMKPVPGVDVVLVTMSQFTPYSGMLPGLVAGLYGFDDAHIDAGRLADVAGARFVEGIVIGLDLAAREARCADGSIIGYDVLSLDIGISPAAAAVPGAAEYALPVKPIGGFLSRFDDLLGQVRAGCVCRIALVGGGAGGVELALAVAHRLRLVARGAGKDPGSIDLRLVTRGSRILPALPAGASRRLERHLSSRRVALLCDARVTAVAADHLQIEGRPPLPVEAVLWVTQAAAPVWLRGTGLPLDPLGFIQVDAGLNVRRQSGVFAVGDAVRFGPRDLPKAGVYAVRQGPVLADNLRRALVGDPPRPYRPQRDNLVLISTGSRHAVAVRNGLMVEGDWVWRIKDWLDRRWIARYQNL